MSEPFRCGGDTPGGGDRPFLVGVLVLAGIVRALAWSRTAVLFNDGPIFLALAQAIREGRVAGVLAHPQHPLYPALVAAGTAAGLAPETAAVAISIAGGLLAVAASHALASRAFGRSVARGSALVVALHPTAVDFSSDVQSDGLYLGLFLAALARGVALFDAPTRGRAIGFGLLAGLADWTRPEGLGLIVVAGVLGVYRCVLIPEARRSLLGIGLIGMLVAGALAGGLRAGEWRAGGELSLSQKKSVGELARGGPSAMALAEDRRERRLSRERADALPLAEGSARVDGRPFDRPPRSFRGLVEAGIRVFRTALASLRYELIPFVLLGLAVARRRGTAARGSFEAWTALVVLAYGGLLVLLVWGAGYVSRRHALPIVSSLVPYAVLGWLHAAAVVRDRVRGTSRDRGAGAILSEQARAASLAALALVLLLGWGPRDLRARRLDRAAERDAAVWLAAHAQGEGGVAAQKLRTAYYAKAPFVPLPDGRDGLIQAQIRRRGARYVVIDEAKLGDHLGLAEGIGTWLREIHVVRAGDQRVLVLERVGPPAD